MKWLLGVLFSGLFVFAAPAAQVVNVQYIHDLIQQRWDITVPKNELLTDSSVVANMEYLLRAIDVANYKLNGWQTTNYVASEYATTAAADTVAAQQAVNGLIKFIGFPFKLTTTETTDYFQFTISAKGTFYVNWGDGTEERINRTDTNEELYTHTYDEAGEYTIELDGKATAYSNGSTTPAISFNDNQNIAAISGSLGQIFSTLANGTQPKFYYTFGNNPNLTGGIPPALFSGVAGKPAKNMFYGTFYGDKNLNGEIPAGLFSEIKGDPMEGVFYRTFENCSGLSGGIPDGLFDGLSGPPARDMFHATFAGCSGLTGNIPSGLFAGISGAPAQRMYNATFSGCSGLTGAIPNALFGRFDGAPQELMFGNTFFSCSGLTGAIPADLFTGITGQPAKRMFEGTFNVCTGLTGSIPADLFAGLDGVPVEKMFYNTFAGCSGLSGVLPAGLFAGISGDVAPQIFYRTFYNCSNLTGIADGAFGELAGTVQNQMFTETFYRNYALTGDSVKSGGKYLYEIWPDATKNYVGGMYSGDTGLSDWTDIPSVWK
ncbi:MAG: hypothetical protein IKW09_02030 [Alphaproteobacteria bacterium]|nr:hypothetical protein [Alphaproteobacteria bacterium]